MTSPLLPGAVSGAGQDWSAPGAHPVAEGIHRIVLPMPQDGLRAVNVYAVQGPAGLALVDAGWRVPGALEVLSAGLGQIGCTLADVTDVHVTHIHRDHYTLGPELRRACGARIHLGAEEAPGLAMVSALRSNSPEASLRELARAGADAIAGVVARMEHGEPWRAADWEEPDVWTSPGTVALAGRPVEAVLTPGHTKGHLVFHDHAAGLLFSGDHVLPTITPSIGFELGDWDLPLGNYLSSLELLLTRPDAILLPAHGPVGGGVHERVRALLEHHRVRLDATRDQVLDHGASTGLEVASGLLWTRRGRSFGELDVFNKMIAVCETMAHLDVLVEQGEIAVEPSRGGVDRFLAR
ncbi:MBL fold metallo-hydrolase [Nocardioides yefusunii]|uniref:MBL fold metallo-hydrolase n=1 Tax=Nocardioides yefusunii TaxID=2500546 RepID=A0ABW1QTL1_9ACTN|nr:MBL fold metallo-hydrolase [Nocardioides yefusunii]